MLRAGTSGFSYEGWKGAFYPEDLPAKRWLAYYAERLPAVEINNTFYRLPKASVLAGWAGQVPDAFRFSIKASRRITHLKRLSGVEEETGILLDALAALGPKLGVVLFQLPPNLKLDFERLERFLDLLAARVPAAFEFRHESWQDPKVIELLRARGAALCVADTDEAPAPELVATAPLVYLRLRRQSYAAAELAGWVAQLRAHAALDGYVFFKHEDAGVGPRLAAELLSLAGVRSVAPAADAAASRAS
jgi:uncharacterized protein YecE (DUF72 family)